MREVTEAHYLHERHGLEAVLRPPVGYPTALAWVPRREELIVATRDGKLHSVDPVLGTRVVTEGIGEAAVLDIHADRKHYLLVEREGTWRLGDLGGGGTDMAGKHDFLGHIDAFFLDKYVVLLGDTVDGRYLIVFSDGKQASRIRLPKGVVALPHENALKLARSTAAGLDVIVLGKEKFHRTETTGHVLQRCRDHILGVTPTGIAVWTAEGGVAQSMRMPEITAADLSKDGTFLGMGTRHGAVALARMDLVDKRVHPDLVKAFDSPVTTVQFSERGRWLATGGDRLQIWTWED